jgi:hypothetical protein
LYCAWRDGLTVTAPLLPDHRSIRRETGGIAHKERDNKAHLLPSKSARAKNMFRSDEAKFTRAESKSCKNQFPVEAITRPENQPMLFKCHRTSVGMSRFLLD